MVRKTVIVALIAAACYPLIVQLYLLMSVSILGLLVVPLAASLSFLGLLGFLLGIALMVASMFIKKDRKSTSFRRGLILLGLGVYAGGIFPLGEAWVGRQRERNIEQGNRVVRAIEEYREKCHSFPATLEQLKPDYLASVPKWKHGFVEYRFIYWFDDPGASPRLKFCSGAWTGVFYNWETKSWHPSSL